MDRFSAPPPLFQYRVSRVSMAHERVRYQPSSALTRVHRNADRAHAFMHYCTCQASNTYDDVQRR